jgi:hypothetical protein
MTAEPDFDAAYQEAELARLAQLSQFAYGKERKETAKRLGVPVVFLDKEIDARRSPGDTANGQGRPLELPDVEPWDRPVDGAALIGDLVAKIREFVSLGDHDALAVALWIIHAFAYETAFHSPRLAITSPTPRCGKSSLLRCIGRLAPRPLATSNISAPALFRVIEKARPTMLVDEIDQVDEEKRRELVGIINSSHCRLDACVVRTVAVGDDHEPRAVQHLGANRAGGYRPTADHLD